MEEVLIITGGSKGIGRGIISAYLEQGVRVFSISRTVNTNLNQLGVTQFALDLTETDKIQEVFQQIFDIINSSNTQKITLINNAGTLGQIGALEKLDAAVIAETVNLNTTVPYLCSAIFIRNTKNWAAKKTIINITSGAALKPYFGWSLYCGTKAALNMLSQTIAVEQKDVENGVKVLAVAPGVVDTDMQTEIRRSNKEDFKDVDRFVTLKNEGRLNDTDTVGRKIYEADHNTAIESGTVMRIEN